MLPSHILAVGPQCLGEQFHALAPCMGPALPSMDPRCPGMVGRGMGAVPCDSPRFGWFPAALLAQNLNSDDQDVVLRALKRMPEGRLKKEGLKALSLLLVEGNSKVVSAVSAQLRSLAENPRFRQRVCAGQARDAMGWCHSPWGAAPALLQMLALTPPSPPGPRVLPGAAGG